MASTAYDIRLLVHEDVPAVEGLIRNHFVMDETIYRSFLDNYYRDYKKPNPYNVVREALLQFLTDIVLRTHATFVAVNKADSSLVGLVVIHVGEFQNLAYYQRERWYRTHVTGWPDPNPDSILEKITYYLWEIRDNAAVREQYYRARKEMYFMYLTVHNDHRRRGIGTALMQRGMDWAREHGFDLACGIFTSVPSKKIAKRMGMRSVYDCDLREVKNNKGEVVFADMGVNNVVSIMALEMTPTQENEVPN